MKFEKIIHTGVEADGKLKNGGAVEVDGKVIVTRGNCGSDECHCSDGFFLTIIMPRRKLTKGGKYGIVEGIKVQFDSLKDLEANLK